MADQTIGRTLK